MCTSVNITSTDGHVYFGRTQEYNLEFNYSPIQFPRKFEVGSAFKTWNTLYSALGMGSMGEDGIPTPFIIDGVNEHSLSGVTQIFTGSNQYSTVPEIRAAGKFPLSPEQFVLWALTNCKNTFEVEEKIAQVAIADLAFDGLSQGLPQHYMFTDKSGRSIVVEPSKKLDFEVYENHVGVMTNQPTFDWHVTNLQNYTGTSDRNLPDLTMDNMVIPSSGKGSGFIGIPGDYSSASRFVRAAMLRNFIDDVDDASAVNAVFHILSTSDIVRGAIKLEQGRQHTQYTAAYDLENQTLYLKFYDNVNIQCVSLCKHIATAKKEICYSASKTQRYEKINKIYRK